MLIPLPPSPVVLFSSSDPRESHRVSRGDRSLGSMRVTRQEPHSQTKTKIALETLLPVVLYSDLSLQLHFLQHLKLAMALFSGERT